jgi:cyclophilin family peptidyl-prolyl cis-trans isomerase
MITLDNKPKLDDRHVAFGQIIEGYDIIFALQKLGDARQEGETYQRVTIERCGIEKPSSVGVRASASTRTTVGRVRSVSRATKSRNSRKLTLKSGVHLGRGSLARI